MKLALMLLLIAFLSGCGPTPTPLGPDQSWSGWLTAVAGCDIKGNININTGEKIYHTRTGPASGCYPCTKIDMREDERWFCSEAEAIAAGWRASRAGPDCCTPR